MNIALLSPALLALTLIGVFVVRSRPVAAKVGCELLLIIAIGGYLMFRGVSPLPLESQIPHGSDGAWIRALAVVWWLIAARLVATIVVMALGRDARSRQARLFSDLVSGAIDLTAVLIVLNSVLDLPVKGLLATSGVIAIVLGLALQNTLADVFSGIAVGLEQPFHVGDRVTIEEHVEGIVVEMNWRSIRIQTDSEDLATIPNSIVAKSQIINRSVPTTRRAATVEIPTLSAARSDTLIELIRQAILLCPAILEHPAPSIAFKHVGTRMTTLGVTFSVASTPMLATAKSELLRQVRRLFHFAGVLGDGARSSGDILAGLILFESLERDQIAQLDEALVARRLDPGATLFKQGSHGASIYIVRSGIFEILRQQADGHAFVYGRMGPGEYIGEVSMMSGDPRAVTVVALSTAEVLELPRSAVEALLSNDSELSAALERSIHRGLALLDRDPAARIAQPLDEAGTLLGKIRAFLGHKNT